jgi:hypothetical protein
MIQPLTIIALICAALFLLFFAAAVSTARKRRYVRGFEYLLLAVLMVSISLLFAVTTAAVRGYQALTHETTAAEIEVHPRDGQRFSVQVRFPDGVVEVFDLAGDELYIDARIIKWKPLFNLMGLHTAYELDRIGGRYSDIDEERGRERSLYRLASKRPVDLFDLRRRFALLAPLVDAEYGSATFTGAREGGYELRVSTSGLLIRRLETNPIE